MAQFLNDTLTDTNATALSSHTGESGHSWSAVNSFVISNTTIQSNRAQSSVINNIGYASSTPGSANYSVTTVWSCHENNPGSFNNYGSFARHQVGATQLYSFSWNGNGGFWLYKNAATQLGSTITASVSSGVQYAITIDVNGTTIAGRVQRLSDNQWLTSGGTWQSSQVNCISVTDSSITLAGKAGAWFGVSNGSTTGMSLDSVTANDSTASLSSGTASTSSTGSTTATVTCGVASGGVSPYTYQWYRSTSTGFTPGAGNIVSGATSLTLNDTGLTNGATYYYVCRVTDSASATANSNEVSATPVANNDFAVNNSNIFFSPYNWRVSGSSFAQTNCPGAYIKTKFTGASCTLLLDTSSLSGLSSGNYPALQWSIDGGSLTRSQLTSGQVTLSLASGLSAGTHTLELYVCGAWWSSDRWVTEFVKITGLRLATGASLSAPTLYTKRMIVYADSNGEGYESLASGVSVVNQDATVAFPQLIARAFECEVGVVAYAGQGYITAGGGNVPALSSSWNLYSSGQSRLSAGLLSPSPDWIISTHGQNDSTSPATTVTSLIGAWRTAAPSAKIAICSPSNLNQATNIQSGVTTAADANAKWVTAGESIYISSGTYVNGVHLTGLRGHPRYASALVGKIDSLFSSGTYPNSSQVLNAVSFGPTGADYTGNVVLPSTANVKSGVTFGPSSGSTGTCGVPTASQVLSGVSVDATTGNVVLPSVGNVRSGTAFGVSNGSTGTLAMPSASQVLAGIGFGTSSTEFTGNVVLPSTANVKSGITFGAASVLTGTCSVPTASQVLAGVSVDATTGNVVLPSAGDVRLGTIYGASSGVTGTLSATYTSAANVRFGTDRGDGVTGTLRVPTASQVLSGVLVDATTGNVVLPPIGDVQESVAFGSSSALIGTFVVPTVGQVQSGVNYGAGGTEFVGTLTGGGSGLTMDQWTALKTVLGLPSSGTTPTGGTMAQIIKSGESVTHVRSGKSNVIETVTRN